MAIPAGVQAGGFQMSKIHNAWLGSLVAALVCTGAAAEDAYPSKPVRMIVSFAAGGPTDIVGRVMSAKMGELLGQQFIVENRTGAGGNTGAADVARAAPDGYTLLAGSVGTHAFAPVLSAQLPYDPIKDFEPISLFALVQNLLVVNPKLPATNVAELVTLAKANPGKLNYASGGPGSTSHFAVAMFVSLAGLRDVTVHVPFRGGSPAMTATVAGDTQFFFSPIAGMVPFVEAGSVRALAVSGEARSQALPNVPTIAEAGMPRYRAVGWFGLMTPAGTPQPIIEKLADAVGAASRHPDVIAALRAQGIEPAANRPQVFAAFIRDQLELHRQLVKDIDLKIGE
jgi:tripartite-type tricarboxylate transporter receptor subunit TctC